jgi:mono/diheme cytochrome c family protein
MIRVMRVAPGPASGAAAAFGAVGLLALLALGGCGSARRGEPLVGARDLPDAELALGRRVFDANCSSCHPGGEGGLGFAINNKPLPGWLIRWQVRNGAGAMPSFSREEIDREELDAVIRYLVWLRRQGP